MPGKKNTFFFFEKQKTREVIFKCDYGDDIRQSTDWKRRGSLIRSSWKSREIIALELAVFRQSLLCKLELELELEVVDNILLSSIQFPFCCGRARGN